MCTSGLEAPENVDVVRISTRTHNKADSLLDLLNRANIIPFIARLGMHSIFIHVIIYRGGGQSMEVNKQINIKTQTNVNSELGYK